MIDKNTNDTDAQIIEDLYQYMDAIRFAIDCLPVNGGITSNENGDVVIRKENYNIFKEIYYAKCNRKAHFDLVKRMFAWHNAQLWHGSRERTPTHQTSMKLPKNKQQDGGLPLSTSVLFAPFADWSNGAEYYYGYTVDSDGNNVTDPDEDQPDLTEWHLEYVGREIYELEYCPAENCSTTVYRGHIPTREFFVALMSSVENAPRISWHNNKNNPTQQNNDSD